MNRRTRKPRKQETATSFPPVQDDVLQAGPVVPQQTMHEVPPIVQEVLSTSGRPLDRDTQAFMQSRLGHDFSQVRVHTDERAVESAQQVNALAYTVGRDVVFGENQYAPETNKGQELIAHELTHVVQQTNKLQPKVEMSQPGDRYEQEADQAAQAMSQGILPSLSQQRETSLMRQSKATDAAKEMGEREKVLNELKKKIPALSQKYGDYKKAFEHYDVNPKDGALNKDEVVTLLTDIDVGTVATRDSTAQEMIKTFDKNDNNKLEWEEFEILTR